MISWLGQGCKMMLTIWLGLHAAQDEEEAQEFWSELGSTQSQRRPQLRHRCTKDTMRQHTDPKHLLWREGLVSLRKNIRGVFVSIEVQVHLSDQSCMNDNRSCNYGPFSCGKLQKDVGSS